MKDYLAEWYETTAPKETIDYKKKPDLTITENGLIRNIKVSKENSLEFNSLLSQEISKMEYEELNIQESIKSWIDTNGYNYFNTLRKPSYEHYHIPNKPKKRKLSELVGLYIVSNYSIEGLEPTVESFRNLKKFLAKDIVPIYIHNFKTRGDTRLHIGKNITYSVLWKFLKERE